MNATNIKFIRQDGVNDIFSYRDSKGNVEYIKFPKSMEMSIEDVNNWLN